MRDLQREKETDLFSRYNCIHNRGDIMLSIKRNNLALTIIALSLSFFGESAFAGEWVTDLTLKGLHSGHRAEKFYVYTVVGSNTVGCSGSNIWLYLDSIGDTTQYKRNRAY